MIQKVPSAWMDRFFLRKAPWMQLRFWSTSSGRWGRSTPPCSDVRSVMELMVIASALRAVASEGPIFWCTKPHIESKDLGRVPRKGLLPKKYKNIAFRS